MHTKFLMALCCAAGLGLPMVTHIAHAEDYIVDCVQDESVSPEKIIVSCKNAIRTRKFEN